MNSIAQQLSLFDGIPNRELKDSAPGPIDIVADSSGLKIDCAGEWRAEAYYMPKKECLITICRQ